MSDLVAITIKASSADDALVQFDKHRKDECKGMPGGKTWFSAQVVLPDREVHLKSYGYSWIQIARVYLPDGSLCFNGGGTMDQKLGKWKADLTGYFTCSLENYKARV